MARIPSQYYAHLTLGQRSRIRHTVAVAADGYLNQLTSARRAAIREQSERYGVPLDIIYRVVTTPQTELLKTG